MTALSASHAITVAYRQYMVEWLRIARHEFELVFDQQLPTPQ
jgi:hypothetical protein